MRRRSRSSKVCWQASRYSSWSTTERSFSWNPWKRGKSTGKKYLLPSPTRSSPPVSVSPSVTKQACFRSHWDEWPLARAAAVPREATTAPRMAETGKRPTETLKSKPGTSGNCPQVGALRADSCDQSAVNVHLPEAKLSWCVNSRAWSSIASWETMSSVPEYWRNMLSSACRDGRSRWLSGSSSSSN